MKKISKVLFVFLLFVAPLVSSGQNYTWTNMPPLPHTLYAPAYFTIGDHIYVISGVAVSFNTTGFPVTMSHEVWDFNTLTNTWTQKTNYPGTAVYGRAALY